MARQKKLDPVTVLEEEAIRLSREEPRFCSLKLTDRINRRLGRNARISSSEVYRLLSADARFVRVMPLTWVMTTRDS